MTDCTEVQPPDVVHQPRRWKLHASDPTDPKWPLCNTRHGVVTTVPTQVDCGTCLRLSGGPRPKESTPSPTLITMRVMGISSEMRRHYKQLRKHWGFSRGDANAMIGGAVYVTDDGQVSISRKRLGWSRFTP